MEVPLNIVNLFTATVFISLVFSSSTHPAEIDQVVSEAAQPVMQQYGLPGMAIGIVQNGQSHIFNYGVASKKTGKAVDDNTLFEIGSVSKTFTAALTSYAQITGGLSLADSASRYLPALNDSAFDHVTLLDLATHTAGGLPLQVPDEITNDHQLIAYFKEWKPTYAPGSYRVYSNLSIGLLGLITGKSMGEDFVSLMEGKMFPALGLKHTYLKVPPAQLEDYAQGYTDTDKPVRMQPGMLDAEAYGVRTTATDLLRFLQMNMNMLALDEKWQRAITATHTGYYRIGVMTQDLIWEQYPYPVALKDLLAGNSSEISSKPNPADKVNPPLPPQDDVFINKTGSTNGFSTYVAFVPARKFAIVLLANKRFPNDARVTLAYDILTRLAARDAKE